MITEKDLQEAIAECQGQREPNANTCIKLAAFLTIKDYLYPESKEQPEVTRASGYSYSPEPEPEEVQLDSGTEFALLVNGADSQTIWPIIDELMSVLATIHPRLYDSVLRNIEKTI